MKDFYEFRLTQFTYIQSDKLIYTQTQNVLTVLNKTTFLFYIYIKNQNSFYPP